jgi:hypothetical protein
MFDQDLLVQIAAILEVSFKFKHLEPSLNFNSNSILNFEKFQ